MKQFFKILKQINQKILVIITKRFSKKKIGRKGKEKWYPKYAPHIILGTQRSILDDIELYCKENGYYKGNYWFPSRKILR